MLLQLAKDIYSPGKLQDVTGMTTLVKP